MAMKQYCITLEPKLVKEVDACVKSEGLHSSRNDFVRDAVREKVLAVRRERMRRDFQKLAEKARARGFTGRFPTREERAQLADELLREKGLL
ncbi:MAG TPA: hypothetical protein HA252_01955 [Candidatus Diapherotrites archaeon]|uniref:Ribbon-helix-helix protein, CopG family n=1 Tax=Candidatus Iainarchaeum sp. TaxID=3101447 RepID=A0A7J4JEL0_9ARCH|nr:hypothetical protein [Candidatus Diapherotrites archaeon]HIH16148.1 hypothetical protein [Candidatus Diapherotrites archaeon]